MKGDSVAEGVMVEGANAFAQLVSIGSQFYFSIVAVIVVLLVLLVALAVYLWRSTVPPKCPCHKPGLTAPCWGDDCPLDYPDGRCEDFERYVKRRVRFEGVT